MRDGSPDDANLSAFEDLYRSVGPRAARLAFVITRDREVASDLTQEAFVRLMNRTGALTGIDSPAQYVLRTVANLANGYFRRKRLEKRALSLWVREAPLTEDLPDIGTADDMHQGLLRLPVRQRTALVLRYLEDLSERETADILGLSERAVNALVSRGLRGLRDDEWLDHQARSESGDGSSPRAGDPPAGPGYRQRPRYCLAHVGGRARSPPRTDVARKKST